MNNFDPYIELNHIPCTDPLWALIAIHYPVSQYPNPVIVANLLSNELVLRYQKRTA